MIQNIRFYGIVKAQVRDATTGTLIRETEYHNTDTYFMRASVAKWLAGTATTSTLTPPSQIGAGTGFGTPSPSDTALFAPISGTQRNCDSISTALGYFAQYNLQYQTSDPNGPYSEVGLFDANNNLWAHASISEYKASGQTLTIQWMVGMVADTSNVNAVSTNYLLQTIVGWLSATQTTTSNPPPKAIQLGTGNGSVSSNDTSLFTATQGTLQNCSYIYISALYNVQYGATYTANYPNGNFTEIGLFDGNNNLWLHAIISNSNKTGNAILSVLTQVSVNGD